MPATAAFLCRLVRPAFQMFWYTEIRVWELVMGSGLFNAWMSKSEGLKIPCSNLDEKT